MFKMINSRGRLTKTARDVLQGAYGINEMIIIPDVDARKFKRVTDIVESVNLAWYEFDGDIYVNQHWFIEAVSDRSKRASTELESIIRIKHRFC